MPDEAVRIVKHPNGVAEAGGMNAFLMREIVTARAGLRSRATTARSAVVAHAV